MFFDEGPLIKTEFAFYIGSTPTFYDFANHLWINLGDGKCGFLKVRPPEKAGEAKVRVRVRALAVMDLALMSQLGFPVVKWPREAKVKGPHHYHTVAGVCFTRLHRGPSVAEVTPLSAPISVLIDRNDTITVWFFVLVFSWLLHKEYMVVNDKLFIVTNCGRTGRGLLIVSCFLLLFFFWKRRGGWDKFALMLGRRRKKTEWASLFFLECLLGLLPWDVRYNLCVQQRRIDNSCACDNAG